MKLKSILRTRRLGLFASFLGGLMVLLPILSVQLTAQAAGDSASDTLPAPPAIYSMSKSVARNEATSKNNLMGFAASSGAPAQYGISYHGGPVMSGCKVVYYIWYGNWSGNTTTILTDFANGMVASWHFSVDSSYSDQAGNKTDTCYGFGGSISDNYSGGKKLDNNGVWTVVNRALNAGRLPRSSSAIYVVFTAKDVVYRDNDGVSGACGFHTHAANAGVDVKYVYVGDPSANTSCITENISPNNNPAADSMANILAHEIDETVTDPDLNAWYDANILWGGYYENADKCINSYGQTYKAPNGAKYNLTFSGRNWLIQQVWLNTPNSGCASSYYAPPPIGRTPLPM